MLVNVSHLKWKKAIKTERVCKEKNLPWLFGVDRKLCPSGSLFGVTDAEQWPLGQFSIHTKTVMIDSYILTWDQSGVQTYCSEWVGLAGHI